MGQLANEAGEVTLRERLIATIRQILGPSASSRPLPIDARLGDLGISSLKMVKLMLALEMQFDVEIPQSAITPDNFASIASVEALIVRLSDSAAR